MTPNELMAAAKCFDCLGPKQLQEVIAYLLSKISSSTELGGCCVAQTTSTPTISSDATALAANPLRKGWRILNMGTNRLYVLRGAGAGTTSGTFEMILQPGSAQDDGLGGSWDDTLYQGIVTVAGTSPRYIAVELI